MSPRELIQVYSKDERLNNGRFFSSGGLDVAPGDHVGVVLLVPGAPGDREEVSDYIYRRLMGPTRGMNSIGAWGRHFLSRLKARFTSDSMKDRFDCIGGGEAIHRMNCEQADAVQREIRARTNLPDSVSVSTYLGSPFGAPKLEEAAARMVEDEVSHVILFPLFPQYAAGTTGRGLAQWEAMLVEQDLPRWQTVAVWEYSRNRRYVRALSDRIDQALRRFPRHVRNDVHLLFAAHGPSPTRRDARDDPYCCLVHNTVDSVMTLRGNDRLFTLSFVRNRLLGSRISPDLKARLTALKKTGSRAILVIPVDYVSEQFDTAYLLDVRMREEADRAGILHYHVATGLNCHPLFIEGVADLVVERITPGRVETNGVASFTCPRSDWHQTVATGSDLHIYRQCGICPYQRHHLERAAERESAAYGGAAASRAVVGAE